MIFKNLFSADYWKKFWLLCSDKEKKVIIVSLFLFFASLIFLLLGYYRAHTKLVPVKGGELVEGVVGTVSSFNPVVADFNEANRVVISLTYDSLLAPDGKGGFEPDLAESWKSLNDGSVWRVILKDDIYWQDGEKITTDDIVFTIEKILDPRLRSPLANVWDGVVVKAYDKRIIEFYLKEPYQFFERNLADLKIIPKHIWENIPVDNYWLTDYNLLPVGSGPFVVDSYQKTGEGTIKSVILVPNKRYFDHTPYLNKIVFKFYKDYDEAGKMLLDGKINSLADVSLLNYQKTFLAKKIKKVKIPRFYAVFFNNQGVDIFKDKNVREALALAVPKEKIVKDVLAGQGVAVNTPFIQGMEGWSSDFDKNLFNLQKAREILINNGFATSSSSTDWVLEKKVGKDQVERLEFDLLFPESSLLFRVANILKKSWQKIGVKVNLVSKPIDKLREENIFPRDYQALLLGEIVTFHPDFFSFWHSSQKFDPGLNIAMFDNEEVDKILEEIRTSPKVSEREKLYHRFQEILLEENPAVFLFSPDYLWLLPSSLKGLDYLQEIDYPFERFVGAQNWYIKEVRK